MILKILDLSRNVFRQKLENSFLTNPPPPIQITIRISSTTVLNNECGPHLEITTTSITLDTSPGF